jgi:peptidyl-prolyl cis-trans isomerase C
MRQLVRFGLVALMAGAVAATASAQAPPSGKSAAPGAAKKAKASEPTKGSPGVPAASPDEVLATVNGQPITRGDVVEYLGLYTLPPNLTEQQLYDAAMTALANTELLTQYLGKQKVVVTDKEIDDTVGSIDKDLRAGNQNLATRMAETGTSMAELRDKIRRRLQWKNFVTVRATDAELKKFADENKDTLSGAQVRASHILLMVDPSASAAEKEQTKQKLLAIKKDIEGGKITFAEAANKYSEDPSNQSSKAGGDLNFFPRKGHFIEEFAKVAFALKKGEISEPVDTRYGYHLIQVTDRIDGQPVDFAQKRDEIFNSYASYLQEKIITDARKVAKIETKPMPTDLFQPAAGANPAPTASTGAGAAPKSAGAPKNAPPR